MSNRYYYNDSYGSHKERKSLLRVVARILFGVISIASALLLALALLAPIITPQSWWLSPILGLISPAVYVANIIIAMVWIIRWRWRFVLPIVVLLLLGAGKVSRFMKLDIRKEYAVPSSRSEIKIMSYNLRSHIRDDKQSSSQDISKYLDSISPDIFCAQELRDSKFEQNLPRKFKSYNKSIEGGIGIYSKYPIVAKSERASVDGDARGLSTSMWVDVKIKDDTIRIFNNHLVSTAINNRDDEYISSREFLADSLREDRLIDIIRRFNNSSTLRAQHADSLKSIINASPHRVVVCGDFNDTPMSYTYQTMARGLSDAFVECGTGVPYTYRGFFNTQRIDYILASKEVQFLSYTIDKETTLSDHLPVIVRFKLN